MSDAIAAGKRLLAVRIVPLGDLSWRSWRYLEEGSYVTASRAADLLSTRAYGTHDELAYHRFVKMVSLCLYNQCADARAELKRVSIPPGAGVWVQNVFRFLTEEIAADALLKAATGRGEQTEARVYIALDLIARGQVDEARPHLTWVAQKGSPDVTEYFVAKAHLKRLTKP